MQQYFSRPALANDVTERLLGASMFSTTTLFLGAARRTGKSNLLMQDVIPTLERAGATVLYVDLWVDKSRDPGDLIAITIANALAAAQGPLARAAQAAGLRKVSIKGVEFTLPQVGKVEGASLADALLALQEKVKGPIVLIVDEAQYAITTKAGMNAMFGLKAARDILNANGKGRFCLVMSGSDRDKLLRLVNGNSAPFFGSHIDDLPLLGSDFVGHIAGQLAVEVPGLTIDNDRLLAGSPIGEVSHRHAHARPPPAVVAPRTARGGHPPSTRTGDATDPERPRSRVPPSRTAAAYGSGRACHGAPTHPSIVAVGPPRPA